MRKVSTLSVLTHSNLPRQFTKLKRAAQDAKALAEAVENEPAEEKLKKIGKVALAIVIVGLAK